MKLRDYMLMEDDLFDMDQIIESELDELIDELDDVEMLTESQKSQLVAKLIGLGFMEKTEDGKLRVKKEIDKEELYKKLGKRGKIKNSKIGKTVGKVENKRQDLVKKARDVEYKVLNKTMGKKVADASASYEKKVDKIGRKINNKAIDVLSKFV